MPHLSLISETLIFSNGLSFINDFRASANAFFVILDSAITFTHLIYNVHNFLHRRNINTL